MASSSLTARRFACDSLAHSEPDSLIIRIAGHVEYYVQRGPAGCHHATVSCLPLCQNLFVTRDFASRLLDKSSELELNIGCCVSMITKHSAAVLLMHQGLLHVSLIVASLHPGYLVTAHLKWRSVRCVLRRDS